MEAPSLDQLITLAQQHPYTMREIVQVGEHEQELLRLFIGGEVSIELYQRLSAQVQNATPAIIIYTLHELNSAFAFLGVEEEDREIILAPECVKYRSALRAGFAARFALRFYTTRNGIAAVFIASQLNIAEDNMKTELKREVLQELAQN